MHELLTTQEMAEADRRAIAGGVPSRALMENAGRAVADEAAKMAPAGAAIAMLCGPGNNGGDGFVAARLLRERGFDVRVACLVTIDQLKGDAAEMARTWPGAVDALSPASIKGAGLVIDALFGGGLSRPLTGIAADTIAELNGSGLPVLAVDVPSGLGGTTGHADGCAVKATRTITFFRKKPGHLLMPGRSLCGEVAVADIGIPDRVLEAIAPMTFENGLAFWLSHFPWPHSDDHKYQRGHAVVVSGPAQQTGAARLAARGALRIGAGLVTLIGNAAATAINATHSTAVMVRQVSGNKAIAELLADERLNAVLIGPGATIGVETAADVLAVLMTRAAAVLDADALSSFADVETGAGEERGQFGFLRGEKAGRDLPVTLFSAIGVIPDRAVVLTPHEGEFKRLFGPLPGSKLDRARAAAQLSGAVVVLKGPDTVIASPDGRAAINANAPPWLATAGSGDVLAGFITGLLAQKMPAFDAACASVWLHGEAADVFGPGLIAEDLPEVLPEILGNLHHVAGAPGWIVREPHS